MTNELHYRRLESMYQAAPLNDFYTPVMQVSEGQAEISIDIEEKYFHAGMAVHGSVYFKMLDDAAFFAANSLETEVFVLTTSFTTYLTKPVSSGKMRAVGRVVNKNRTQFIAESVVYNGKGQEIGRGNGIFVRSKNRLMDVKGYQ
ncbi:PaaI family thioesterase [Aliikangiella coralliicola]|uniref:PaaI family thioesterase n=1 Tax=Aliikangiella coralliicola TaxID=2592383 RepID=A0A545UJX5_9GAMM|nr:PaaI family thioesterase [Aliikangiella coralliicola]TQV89764.1 PaaI family thioesterase [Aliikangiella coralliicola]